jgi:cysteine synthase A
MKTYVPGPTYQEMLSPVSRGRSSLFDITWRAEDGRIHSFALPPQLTGVKANIVVMTGRYFPSGSHKVGPAYSTLMEGELAGEIDPSVNTVIGPSTGNFGIGTAFVSKLKGYPAIVIMPEGMSAERYQRIRQYGGSLDLTPGSESDVILVLERTEFYKRDPKNKILAQFELLPNYRFHRYVTGRSAIEAARAFGNGRIAAFVGAPGSAGTLAAGDEIKAAYSEAQICALEPRECSTLYNNGCGTHAIEGIGDKMVTLIHNVLTTDYVALIHDQDCLVGLELLERRTREVERTTGLAEGSLEWMRGMFGVSGICNILGAIRFAKHVGLGAGDNVVTIATDGFDRYPSVLDNLEKRTTDFNFEQVFRGGEESDFLDVRPAEQKQRLFGYKEAVWTRFGYTRAYLDSMKSQSFWDGEYEKIGEIDARLEETRAECELQPTGR